MLWDQLKKGWHLTWKTPTLKVIDFTNRTVVYKCVACQINKIHFCLIKRVWHAIHVSNGKNNTNNWTVMFKDLQTCQRPIRERQHDSSEQCSSCCMWLRKQLNMQQIDV